MNVTYTCNPDLNVNCPKTSCYINGGSCRRTKFYEFAAQPVEAVTVTVPMSDEEYAEIVRGKPSALSIIGPNRKTRRTNKNGQKSKRSN